MKPCKRRSYQLCTRNPGANPSWDEPVLCVWQVIKPALLREGFELIQREGTEVTDDVSIIEALGKPVKITQVCNLCACCGMLRGQ